MHFTKILSTLTEGIFVLWKLDVCIVFGIHPVNDSRLFVGYLQTPAAVEVTPLTLIDTEEGLQKLCEQLKKETEIAVDLEVRDG